MLLSQDWKDDQTLKRKYEAIRKTDVFYNAFITEEIAVQKKRIGAEAFATMIEQGNLKKFMEISRHVGNKLDIRLATHEGRELQMRKGETQKEQQDADEKFEKAEKAPTNKKQKK